MSRAIKLLGEPAILDEEGRPQSVRGHQAWALLARVVLARGPLDRRSLAGELFPDTADPLGSLRWSLAALRKALNCSDCLSGDPLEARFPPGTVFDVVRLDGGELDLAHVGPLLGSIDPRCSPEFSTWLLIERERLAGIVDAKVRQETLRALSVGDHEQAIRHAELAVRRDPLDESAHILLVKGLVLAGLHEAAAAHVKATEQLFQDELGEKPSPALRSAARQTISAAPVGVSPGAFVNSLVQAGLAALSAGVADAGIDCLRRAAQEAEKAGDKHLLGKTLLELGTALVHSVRGYDDEGAVLLHQSAELGESTGDRAITVTALRELAYVEALAGRRPSSAAHLDKAAAAAEGHDALAGVHAVAAFNLVDWGRVNEGLERYHCSLEHARLAGNRRREIWCLGLGAWGLLAANRLDEAYQWLSSCLELVDQQRWVAFRPWPVALLQESKLRQGASPEKLRPALEEAFALSCQLGDPCWEAMAGRVIGLAYAAEDKAELALEWLGEGRKRCMRVTDNYAALQVELLANQADLHRRVGNTGQADALAREWLAQAARTHADSHVATAAKFLAPVSGRTLG